MWKIVTDEAYLNQELIFPTQQRDVNTLIQYFQKIPEIKQVRIFGSSVTSACNPWSDIDVFLDMSEYVPLRAPRVAVPVDLWTNFDADDRFMREIEEKGVVVYERGNTDG